MHCIHIASEDYAAATLRSEVRHDDGRLMATAIGSYAIFPRRRRPPTTEGSPADR